jgi:Holliday junction DNA helicase RuvA
MFAYIKGILEYKEKDFAVVDAGGIGYKISIPYSTYNNLPEIGDTVKLNTYLAVREDNVSLFGFLSKEEKRIFELLISVSGIGPKLALGVLSGITAMEFSVAVITEDMVKLTNISGIGKKTAQRIIIELKDKMKKEEIICSKGDSDMRTVPGSNMEEAISALQVLGYSSKDAAEMVTSVFSANMEVEEVIRRALKCKNT